MNDVSELEIMQEIDNSLSKVKDQGTKDRVLQWAWAKHSSRSSPEGKKSSSEASKTRVKRKRGSNSKQKRKALPTIDKNLNLKPKGKKSFRDFCEDKKPTIIGHQHVASVHYLKNELGVSKVSINQVYTCFKDMSWKLPADFRNSLHQAANKGWLDSGEGDDIKVTTVGENLIDHELPKEVSKREVK